MATRDHSMGRRGTPSIYLDVQHQINLFAIAHMENLLINSIW